MKKLFTLCIIHTENKVLLAMKKRGFGEGLWNGCGGKVLETETIEEGARREMMEESGVIPTDLVKLGITESKCKNEESVSQVHIFKCTAYTGTVGESEEMKPQWFNLEDIPFNKMWEDEILWFPLFLEDKKFEGRFCFNEQHEILNSELREVTELK